MANTQALAMNERGLDGVGAATTRLSGATTQAAGSTRMLTSEMKMLEGAMPIRAAASFLSKMEGISAIAGMAFPIFGAVAMVGVLETIIGKVSEWANAHDPVIQAQKTFLSLLEQQGKEYDKLTEKLHKLRLDEYERTHGHDSRLRLEAQRGTAPRAGVDDQQQVTRLEDILTRLNRLAGEHSMRQASTSPLNKAKRSTDLVI